MMVPKHGKRKYYQLENSLKNYNLMRIETINKEKNYSQSNRLQNRIT